MSETRSHSDDSHRALSFERSVVHNAEGSVIAQSGQTKVLVTVSVQDSVPKWIRGHGWLSAEYAMVPAATKTRRMREGRGGRFDARSHEIQRMIGRVLRAAIDLDAMPDKTLWVDCDVLAADGGTRTTAINGAVVALKDACDTLLVQKRVKRSPFRHHLAATSIGRIGDRLLVDLNYEEDSAATVDLNVVRDEQGRLIEVQGAAEGSPFEDDELRAMLDLSKPACVSIVEAQKQALA
ncbi:MAG: ribonuclease PH [Planctomycetota bacterium]